jgi:uncharacterized membrane protein SpoIIM required for sporulation
MKVQNSESQPAKRRSLFWRALLYASIIEIGMLVITGAAMARSFFSHSAADPHSATNNPLANIGIFFHLPSFIITAPLGLIFLAPLVQILLMTGIIYGGLGWWKKMGH